MVSGDEQPDEITDPKFWRTVTVVSSDKIDDVRIGVARLLGTISGTHIALL